MTKADLESLPTLVDEIMLLWGIDPRDLMDKQNNSKNKKRVHKAFDKRSLEDAQIWSELLKIYPEIIQWTIGYLKAQIPQLNNGGKKELKEWEKILESMSYQRLKKFLESDSERATRLRQSVTILASFT